MEQLESGRGLMLRYIMDSRSDLSALANIEPELAEKYLYLHMQVFQRKTSQQHSAPSRSFQEEKHEAQTAKIRYGVCQDSSTFFYLYLQMNSEDMLMGVQSSM